MIIVYGHKKLSIAVGHSKVVNCSYAYEFFSSNKTYKILVSIVHTKLAFARMHTKVVNGNNKYMQKCNSAKYLKSCQLQ